MSACTNNENADAIVETLSDKKNSEYLRIIVLDTGNSLLLSVKTTFIIYTGASYFRSTNCFKVYIKIRMIKLENVHKV